MNRRGFLKLIGVTGLAGIATAIMPKMICSDVVTDDSGFVSDIDESRWDGKPCLTSNKFKKITSSEPIKKGDIFTVEGVNTPSGDLKRFVNDV